MDYNLVSTFSYRQNQRPAKTLCTTSNYSDFIHASIKSYFDIRLNFNYPQYKVNKPLVLVVLLVVLLLIAGLGYFIFQNQKFTGQPAPLPQASSFSQSPQLQIQSPSPQTKKKLTHKEIEEQITAAVNSKNYQALASYMTQPKVNFSLMSSECCEPITPDEAAGQMDYVVGGEPFIFDQQNATIQNLKVKNPQLADAFIGLSTTGEQTASFTIDSNNRISAIQLSISYKLYNQ